MTRRAYNKIADGLKEAVALVNFANASIPCLSCGGVFVPYHGAHKFCSKDCREKEWAKTFRDRAAAKSRQRRKENPEWYRAREPGYYRTYRAKLLSIRPWRYLLTSRRRDAAQKGLAFDLNDAWAASRWTGRCEITQIPFRINGVRGPLPFSPSIDRIDTAKGYTQDNCRFVLFGCNALKGGGTDDDMREIACAIIASSSAHMDSQHD